MTESRTRVVVRTLLGPASLRVVRALCQKALALRFNTRACIAILFALLLAPATPAASLETQTSHWLITTWETDQGLPENSATAMVQTSDGYLWFGTFKGLVRFDGVNFT